MSDITLRPERIRLIREGTSKTGLVVYWMSRDQRAMDNWALLFAQKSALAARTPLMVAFCLVPEFLNVGKRQYRFMLEGLRETEILLRRKNIPLVLLEGFPDTIFPGFLEKTAASILVTDFDPLKIKMHWIQKVSSHISIPFPPNDWDRATASVQADHPSDAVRWIIPGERAAGRMLDRFLKEKLNDYLEIRNNPNRDGQSNLSPYLHFGQISAQRVAFELQTRAEPDAALDAFLEELIVRRELSNNFCFTNPQYDSFEGFPEWARTTLRLHQTDRRTVLYSVSQLESASTHDALWNAAHLINFQLGIDNIPYFI